MDSLPYKSDPVSRSVLGKRDTTSVLLKKFDTMPFDGLTVKDALFNTFDSWIVVSKAVVVKSVIVIDSVAVVKVAFIVFSVMDKLSTFDWDELVALLTWMGDTEESSTSDTEYGNVSFEATPMN